MTHTPNESNKILPPACVPADGGRGDDVVFGKHDTNGRLIHSQALTENVTAIDATDWAKGVYVWKVYANGKEVESG